MNHRFVNARLAALLLAAASCFALAAPSATVAAEPAAGKPAAKKPVAKKPVAKAAKPVPEACGRMIGVERAICIECDGIAFFKRIGCQQRVFWTQCKGKRLFEDSYCQMHQDRGPPGE